MDIERVRQAWKLVPVLSLLSTTFAAQLCAQQGQSLQRLSVSSMPLAASRTGSHASLPLQNGTSSRDDSIALKSPFLAFALSAVVTGVPVGIGISRWEGDNAASFWLVTGGLILGPSAGYIYGGEWGRGLGGAGIRLGIAVCSFLVMGGAATGGWGALHDMIVVGVIGSAAVVVAALYDVFAVGPYISEKNSVRRVFGLSVSPAFCLETHSLGVQLTISM